MLTIPFYELQNIVKKHLKIEELVNAILSKMGSVDEIYLLGDYARG